MKSYNFFYEDKQFMTFELTESDYHLVQYALSLTTPPSFIVLDSCAIATSGLRFVVEIPERENEDAAPPEYEFEKWMYEHMNKEGGELDDEDDGRPV